MQFYGLTENWRTNPHGRRRVDVNGLKLCASSHLGYFGVRMRLRGATPNEKRQAINDDRKAGIRHLDRAPKEGRKAHCQEPHFIAKNHNGANRIHP